MIPFSGNQNTNARLTTTNNVTAAWFHGSSIFLIYTYLKINESKTFKKQTSTVDEFNRYVTFSFVKHPWKFDENL